MDKTIIRIFKIISVILILLAVVFQVMVLVQGEENLSTSLMDNYAYLTYITLALTAVLAIVFPIIFMFMNPKSAVKILISLAILVVIGFIAYAIAGNEFDVQRLQELETTAETSRYVGAALLFTYLIGGLAVISMLVSGVSSIFRK